MIRLIDAIGFILLTFVTFSRGQYCTPRVTSTDEYDCRISSQDDFNTIPFNVTILYVTFTREFGNEFATGVDSLNLSHLLKLRGLNLDLEYIPRLRNGTFAGLRQVEQLVLYRTSSSSEYRLVLEAGSFSGLSGLTELSASNLGISTLPSSVFVGLENLKQLDMHLNQLQQIDSFVFANCCQSLFSVSFAKNRLQDLAGIRTLSHLRVLDLHGNNVTILPRAAFDGLSSLKDMNLGSNDIAEIQDGAFVGLGQLKKLYLDKNKIVNITANMFSELTNLTEIDLQDNALRIWPVDAFSSLKSLTTLVLSINQIQEVQPGALRGLDNLLTLQIDNNGITELNDDTFGDVRSLKRLDLMHNQISSVTMDTFHGMLSLNDLNLGSNRLTSLPEGVFSFISSLTKLNVANNPWNCDCHLHWLAVILSASRICNFPIKITDLNGTTCQLPESNRGTSLIGAFSKTSCTPPVMKCAETTTESGPQETTRENIVSSAKTSERTIPSYSTFVPSASTERIQSTKGVAVSTVNPPTSNPPRIITTIFARSTVGSSKLTIPLRATTTSVNPTGGDPPTLYLPLGHRAGIIIAACIFAVLIVGLSGFVTQRVLRHYSWWRISHLQRESRDNCDGKGQTQTVSVMGDVERGGYDNSGALYDFSEVDHPY